MDSLAEDIRKADSGDVKAMVRVAEYILFDDAGRPEVPELYERAFNYLGKAIAAGDEDAMSAYANALLTGTGIKADPKAAFQWYAKLAEKGGQASCSLGLRYYEGAGTPVSYEKAYKLFEAASAAGEALGTFMLGEMHYLGRYVEPDRAKVFELYLACWQQLGNNNRDDYYAELCLRLGTCLGRGYGTEPDLAAAQELLALARHRLSLCAKDDPYAAEKLAETDREWQYVFRRQEAGH